MTPDYLRIMSGLAKFRIRLLSLKLELISLKYNGKNVKVNKIFANLVQSRVVSKHVLTSTILFRFKSGKFHSKFKAPEGNTNTL